jgi:mandelate racemase/muconate lactonizing enzyme-like protein
VAFKRVALAFIFGPLLGQYDSDAANPAYAANCVPMFSFWCRGSDSCARCRRAKGRTSSAANDCGGAAISVDSTALASGRRSCQAVAAMKIVEVKTYPLLARLEQPFAFSQGVVRKRSATLVEVMTDEGLVGWGEAFNQGLEPPQISAATIEHALKPLVIGGNPLDAEVLWHRMYHTTRDYGRKGSVMAAISAIDIALWDIAGKAGRFVSGCRPMPRVFIACRVRAKPSGWRRKRLPMRRPASRP